MVFNNNLLLGAAGQGGGYEIEQSIRFNNDDTAKLTRTFGTATNRKIFTFSVWVKNGKNSGSIIEYNGTGGVTWANINFGGNRIDYFDYSGGSARIDLRSTAVFRDPSAWYHLVVAMDTTQGTASNRLKFYINGSQITAFGTSTYPSLNFEGFINSSVSHLIGKGVNGPFDGYLAEYHFIDGQALAPTDFGEYNDDGVWIPIEASPTYGNNGFYITGETASDLGEDFSGNNNDFTSSGLATTDQMLDTPTLNYCTMNVLDNGRPANITVSDGNLTCAFAGAGYQGGIRSSIFFDSEDPDGWYAECTLDSLAFASIFRAGVANAAIDLASTDAQSNVNAWAYSDQGAKLNNSYTTGYGSAVTTTDVVGIAVRNGKIYFAVNNVWQGSADPVTESNPAFSNLLGDVAFCQSTNTGGSYAHTATWNFGQSGFAYTPPTGYKALNTANLATPSITDGSAHFDTSLWTGNDTDGRAITGYNFQPDWVWIKSRSGAYSHNITDAVRGAGIYLQSNTTDPEVTGPGAFGSTLAFTSDGYTLDNGTSDNLYVNAGGETYVGWAWKANGAGSSNTDGSINTTATSANTTAGFSISTYTGNGTSGATIGHGLGLVPALVIVKRRDGGSGYSWFVQHKDVGPTKALFLDSISAGGTSANYWNNTAPTSSVFSVGNDTSLNANSGTFLAYCFAEIPGYSSFGSYTGNGSADGPFVYTGFEPAFVLIKRTNATENWLMMDSTRYPYNPANNPIFANTANADANGGRPTDFLSNGFKPRNTLAGMNASGSTYIYMAFAEHPFGGDGVAPATAR